MKGKSFFLSRINDHLEYLQEISLTLEGKGWFLGCSHTECKLGKWIFGKGEGEVAALGNPHAKKIFEELKEPHEHFHQASSNALRKQLAGDKSAAQQAIAEMHQLSTIIRNKLLELDKLGRKSS